MTPDLPAQPAMTCPLGLPNVERYAAGSRDLELKLLAQKDFVSDFSRKGIDGAMLNISYIDIAGTQTDFD